MIALAQLAIDAGGVAFLQLRKNETLRFDLLAGEFGMLVQMMTYLDRSHVGIIE